MNYENKFTTHKIPEVSFPDGLRDETKYTFSITYTDQHSMDYAKFAETTKDIILKDGNSLAPYPDPQGYLELRNLISERLLNLRGYLLVKLLQMLLTQEKKAHHTLFLLVVT